MRWLMHSLRARSHSASMTAPMFISLHIRSMWETICDAQQAGFWLNSKFLSKFSRKPLSGISDQKAPPPLPTPTNEKLQIWDDQRLLWKPPPPNWKTSDLRWPKFTPKYPPSPMKNFRSYVETHLYPPWIPLVGELVKEPPFYSYIFCSAP